jgi:hypothetical protein
VPSSTGAWIGMAVLEGLAMGVEEMGMPWDEVKVEDEG